MFYTYSGIFTFEGATVVRPRTMYVVKRGRFLHVVKCRASLITNSQKDIIIEVVFSYGI